MKDRTKRPDSGQAALKDQVESFPGNPVTCDWCNTDYTTEDGAVIDNTEGGITLLSVSICPKCAAEVEQKCKANHEEDQITSSCTTGWTFVEYVTRLRIEMLTPGWQKRLAAIRGRS